MSNHRPAAVICTNSAVDRTLLGSPEPQTGPPTSVEREQAPESASPVTTSHTQHRPQGGFPSLETANEARYRVPEEGNLRPTTSGVALTAAELEQPKPNPHWIHPLQASEQDSAERALSQATPLAAEERDRQSRPISQLTESGIQQSLEAETEEVGGKVVPKPQEPSPMIAIATFCNKSSSGLEADRMARRPHCAGQRMLICITEGPSLKEIRELRRVLNATVVERVQTSKGQTDERLEQGSPAMRSLRRALLIKPKSNL